MLKNILNLGTTLNKTEQLSINGGNTDPECPTPNPALGCYTGGPFYCNIHGLPICVPLDENV
ncbi:hypothetical protein P8625_02880 [Tenacibaculum tangerinum]|uniref:Bacteriocin n=1 Tax=Tenacibaculum tangerinum TaxID=3038772 RepID=A0ABY8L6X6_9FLAO|nr:hypothetical protein [Tenacibaculum tangerinum]WGH76128.1 hypothetical protein P8625_02880 [Tenacibaculum tangerinum]